MKKVLLSAVATIALSTSAFAAEANFGKIYTECGLGGIIGSAVDDRTASQVIAISTNITWDLGTTASTSYFSSDNTCTNKKAKIASFINQSYEKLEREIANGTGDYVDTLASLVVEDTQANAREYTEKLRTDFSKIVSSKEYATLTRYEKVEKLYNIAL